MKDWEKVNNKNNNTPTTNNNDLYVIKIQDNRNW